MSQSHHNTRRTSVIINLLKLSNGYMVENEKPVTTIQIPKELTSNKKKGQGRQ